MKKILLGLIVALTAVLLIGCGTKAVNYTKLINAKGELETKIFNTVEVDNTALDAQTLNEGSKYILKKDKEAADKLVKSANDFIDNKKGSQKEVDSLQAKIEELSGKANLVVEGLKAKVYNVTKQGLQESLDDFEKVLKTYAVSDDAATVVKGVEFISTVDKKAADDLVKEVKALLATLTDTLSEEQAQNITTTLAKIVEMKQQLATNKRVGTKDAVDPTIGLNLGGATVSFLTHVENEDNPYLEGYSSNVIKRQDYINYIKEIEKQYNFKLEFKVIDNSKVTDEITKHISQSSNKSAIVRLNETKIMIQNIENKNLKPITNVINQAKDATGDRYFVSQWQIDRGTILGQTFGLQREDAKTYPDLLMFNRTLLKQLLGNDAKMPDELWEENKWTFTEFEKLVQAVSTKITDPTVKAVGITPYFIGVNGVLANGVELISPDETKPISERINLASGEVANIIKKYETLVKANGKWNNGEASVLQQLNSGEAINKNQLFDTFKAGKLAIAAFQNWQASLLTDSFEASVVPYPQVLTTQDNSKYVTPIEAGDVLGITRGENSDKVGAVLLLLNKFFKEKGAAKILERTADVGIPADSSVNDAQTAIFVSEKTKNKKTEDILRARKIAALIHGYQENAQTEHSVLATIGIDEEYSKAIQESFHKNQGYAQSINSSLAKMQKKFGDLVKIIEELKNN